LSVGCSWDIFLFSEGQEIFLIQFCLLELGSSFAIFGCVWVMRIANVLTSVGLS